MVSPRGLPLDVSRSATVRRRGKGGRLLQGNRPTDDPADLRAYITKLESALQRRLVQRQADGLGPLTHDDFHASTASINKSKEHAVYGKSQIIHAYRELVRAGKASPQPQIEALLIKKVGKSSYGGVNLSVFIPPGHSAPVWNVRVSRPQPPQSNDEFEDSGAISYTVSVLEQKSTYTLRGYREYCRLKAGEELLVLPGMRVQDGGLHDDMLTIELPCVAAATTAAADSGSLSRSAALKGLWELTLSDQEAVGEGQFGVDGLLRRMAPGDEYLGTLKGTESLKTCTFGCVYCPTEVDAEGEQANPKSYLTHESGVLRAVRNGYSTTQQVRW
eukprot:SAG25_NODE_166_length_13075_cov_19.523736_1_plen_331_part_00